MAMDGNALGDKIAEIITASDAPNNMKKQIKQTWEKIGSAIVDHIIKNAEITVPSSSVIVAVAGQATGTPNPTPISTNIR